VKMKASGAGKVMRICLLQLAAAGTLDVMPSPTVAAFGGNTVDPTFGANLAKIAPVTGQADNATIANTGLSCNLTTAWQRFGGVFTLPTDFKNLALFIFTDSQFAAAEHCNLTEIGIYDGPEFREWTPRKANDIDLNCLRYYWKTFALAVAPAQNAGLIGAERGAVSVAGTGAGQPIGIRFPVPMRKIPTSITFFNPSAANAFVRNTTAGSDATATAAANASEASMDVTFTGIAAWTVAQALAVHATVDAEI